MGLVWLVLTRSVYSDAFQKRMRADEVGLDFFSLAPAWLVCHCQKDERNPEKRAGNFKSEDKER